MKTLSITLISSLHLFLLLGPGFSLFGQVTVGSIPSGTSVISNIIDLRIADLVLDTTAFLDIDEDGNQDIAIWLHTGAPFIDDPRLVIFYMLNDSFSICTDTAHENKYTHLYELGDTICTPGQEWGVLNFYTVGCNGGWGCHNGVTYITNKYLAYRNNATGDIGWMKISSSLFSGVTPDSITFTIFELLTYSTETGLDQGPESFEFDIYPNPIAGDRGYIHCSEKITEMALFTVQGQLLQTYTGDFNDIRIPDFQGLYILRVRNEKGNYAIEKFMKL